MNDDFRTRLPVKEFPFALTHEDKLLCLGSCFAEHISQKLTYYKFQSLLNPFGIQYNPVSLSRSLIALLEEKRYTENDIFQHNHLWHSFDHHSHFSGTDPKQTLDTINEATRQGTAFLQRADFIILSLGSSFVYENKASEQVVANCHKLPGHLFHRRLLPLEEIQKYLDDTIKRISAHFPNIQFLLTVSPVRHIKDGLIDNQRSKSRLLLAAEWLCHHHKLVHYFPSYELLMDDLRDYRFYGEDLIHPSNMAINYIWKYFCQAFMEDSTLTLIAAVEKIKTAAAHRPFVPESQQHQQFLKKQLNSIQELESSYSFLDFKVEKQYFRQQIIEK